MESKTHTTIHYSAVDAAFARAKVSKAFFDLSSQGEYQCSNTVKSSARGELGEILAEMHLKDFFDGSDVQVVETASHRVQFYRNYLKEYDLAEQKGSDLPVQKAFNDPDLILKRSGKTRRIEVKVVMEDNWSEYHAAQMYYRKDSKGAFTVPYTHSAFVANPNHAYKLIDVERTYAQLLRPSHVKKYTKENAIVIWVVVSLNYKNQMTRYRIPGFNTMEDFANGVYYVTGEYATMDNVAATRDPRPISELAAFIC